MDDLSNRIDQLLEQAMSNPVDAYATGMEMLGQIPSDDHRARSKVLRALGVAARLADRMSESIKHATGSVEEAVLAADQGLQAESLMSLAGSHALSGDNSSALAVLESIPIGSNEILAAQVEAQKGAVLTRMGALAEARRLYLRALPVFTQHSDAYSEALARQDLGTIEMATGRLDQAETELLRARGLFEELGLEMKMAACDHALGFLASYRGDLVGALRLLDESERRYGELVDAVAEIQVSRCEVLLSAGLISEAARLADSIAEVHSRLGLGEEQAEARLVAAEAAFLAGDWEDALRRAKIASYLFEEQGREVWQYRADLVEISCLLRSGQVTVELLDRARAVADRLSREQQNTAASNARLTAAEIALALDQPDDGIADLAKVAEVKTGPVETRLQSWLAEAMMFELQGEPRRAMAAARSGMELLDRYQAALGASDIRAGIETHARRVGELGMRLALETGDALRSLEWMERSRARSLRTRPVVPPADEKLMETLAELRQVTNRLREATGDEAAELRTREAQLQQAIRRKSRMSPGRGRGLELGNITKAVADSLGDRVLIELGEGDGSLWAVIGDDGGFELRELGPIEQIHRELESLRFAMRRLARRGGSPGIVFEIARRLDNRILAGFEFAGRPVMVVPTPSLYATPWAALPSLRNSDITVSPSAELWLKRAESRSVAGSVVVAAGPGLEHADLEVEEVAGLHDEALVWGPAESAVDEVVDALDGSALAHIASHAVFEYENPMFSSLQLADGDLYVYDLEGLARPPGTVVLSACDSGFTESRAGDELLGLSASLLAMGTRTVVASIGLVPDSAATRELMVEFHRALLDGVTPSQALRAAQRKAAGTPDGMIAAASFICIGGG